MKYKITDLMDLYEDKNCPLAPMYPPVQKNENQEEKEFYEVSQSKHRFGWKQGLSAAAAVALLVAGGFGVKALLSRGSGTAASPASSAEDPAYSDTVKTEPVHTILDTEAESEAPETLVPTEATEETPENTRHVLGELDDESLRFNQFLTGFVQQGIVNTNTDLDEDEELVRFVFRYRWYNDKKSVLEEEDGDILCRTLTLEEVNETLSSLLGRTITPDREDYSIVDDTALSEAAEDNEQFTCFFHDGRFWYYPPFYTYEFGFPLYFALVDGIDEENCTVHFRYYRVNPYNWEVGEADRHVPLLPMMTFLDADKNADMLRIGMGEATLRDFGEDLQLVEFSIELVEKD